MDSKILVLLNPEYVSALDISGGKSEYISIDGRERLDCKGIDTVKKFWGYIVDYYNLNDIFELDTDILIVDCGIDKRIAEGFYNDIAKLEKCNAEYKSEADLIKMIFSDLSKDKDLKITKYGINFNGFHYMKSDKGLTKGSFDLLAYTANPDETIRLLIA